MVLITKAIALSAYTYSVLVSIGHTTAGSYCLVSAIFLVWVPILQAITPCKNSGLD